LFFETDNDLPVSDFPDNDLPEKFLIEFVPRLFHFNCCPVKLLFEFFLLLRPPDRIGRPLPNDVPGVVVRGAVSFGVDEPPCFSEPNLPNRLLPRDDGAFDCKDVPLFDCPSELPPLRKLLPREVPDDPDRPMRLLIPPLLRSLD